MRAIVVGMAALLLGPNAVSAQQAAPRSLALVIAHPDDEGAVSPILARYGREGVAVHLIIATDGAAGSKIAPVAPGPELARLRAEEARCATGALGIKPPILLEFPDGQLGSYADDPVPAVMTQLTDVAKSAWNGVILLAPASGAGAGEDVFR